MPKIRTFNKIPLSYADLVLKLKADGLAIADTGKAESILKSVNYYRLRGYGMPFEIRTEDDKRIGKFEPGISLEKLLNAHKADTAIRSWIMEAIELIELSVRNTISHQLGCKYNDAHWFLKPELFKPSERFTHSEFLKLIKSHTAKTAAAGTERAVIREVFLSHYYNNYDVPEYPPFWMVAEVMSLGAWSKVYEHLKNSNDRKIIAREYDLSPAILQSWLHAMTYLRNLCAHQARLFSRRFVIRPSSGKNAPISPENNVFKNYICVAYWFIKQLDTNSDHINNPVDILENADDDIQERYGFEGDWLSHPYWLDE